MKKPHKNEKSAKAKEVPEDFEPHMIDETEDGMGEIITSAQPPQETAKTDSPTNTKR